MNGMAARDKMFATLDEPTSNLDSLNEAVILKVLRDEGACSCLLYTSPSPRD